MDPLCFVAPTGLGLFSVRQDRTVCNDSLLPSRCKVASKASRLVMNAEDDVQVSRRSVISSSLVVLGLLAAESSALIPAPAYALSKKRMKFVNEWTTGKGGVRWRDISIGKGIEPREGDTVAMHFSLFYNNMEVESSRESSGLAALPYGFTFGALSGPGSVLPGLTIGIGGKGVDDIFNDLMKVGGIRLIEIPPQLAFADKGKKPLIPAGATVEYAVQILSVKRSGTNVNVSPGIGSSMF